MATNDFLPFAGAAGANVITQAAYAALAAQQTGFQSGVANSAQLNKVWRQSSIMAAVLAQFIANTSGQNAVDDGTTATLQTNLQNGILALSQAQTGTAFQTGGTAPSYTLTPSPALQAYAANQRFRVAFGANGTTGSNTLNISGLGAKNLVQYGPDGTLVPAVITNGLLSDVEYNGTSMVVLDPVSTGFAAIPPITASVASNALTLTLGPTALSFRSSTLGSGAVTSLSIGSAITLTVPSGATLGTSNGVAAQLALIVAYNAGTPVLCIANAAGGINLDEAGVISPTTISSSATSAGVIYSASAVAANSPYRVIGFVNVTEATAGTWATAPSLVQGIGGMAIADLLGSCSVFGSSLAASGYQKLPSGLIIQWGTVSAAANGSSATNNFPTSFTDYTTVQVVASYNSAGPSFSAQAIGAQAISNTQFNTMNSSASSVFCRYIAIGK